ncbi:MAG TPA: hypothetical protein VEZ55_11440, partial [Chitinophagaceae bacterium]|nr:hypothetical protein [Chitinophagaceae bacterium]
MQRLFNDLDFHDEAIRCSKCGWEGSGYDAHIVDFYGLTKVRDVHCPSCDSYIGGISRTNTSLRRSDSRDRGFEGDSL